MTFDIEKCIKESKYETNSMPFVVLQSENLSTPNGRYFRFYLYNNTNQKRESLTIKFLINSIGYEINSFSLIKNQNDIKYFGCVVKVDDSYTGNDYEIQYVIFNDNKYTPILKKTVFSEKKEEIDEKIKETKKVIKKTEENKEVPKINIINYKVTANKPKGKLALVLTAVLLLALVCFRTQIYGFFIEQKANKELSNSNYEEAYNLLKKIKSEEEIEESLTVLFENGEQEFVIKYLEENENELSKQGANLLLDYYLVNNVFDDSNFGVVSNLLKKFKLEEEIQEYLYSMYDKGNEKYVIQCLEENINILNDKSKSLLLNYYLNEFGIEKAVTAINEYGFKNEPANEVYNAYSIGDTCLFNGEEWIVYRKEGGQIGLLRKNPLCIDLASFDTFVKGWDNGSIREYLNDDYYNSLSENAKKCMIKFPWEIEKYISESNKETVVSGSDYVYALSYYEINYDYLEFIKNKNPGFDLLDSYARDNSFSDTSDWQYVLFGLGYNEYIGRYINLKLMNDTSVKLDVFPAVTIEILDKVRWNDYLQSDLADDNPFIANYKYDLCVKNGDELDILFTTNSSFSVPYIYEFGYSNYEEAGLEDFINGYKPSDFINSMQIKDDDEIGFYPVNYEDFKMYKEMGLKVKDKIVLKDGDNIYIYNPAKDTYTNVKEMADKLTYRYVYAHYLLLGKFKRGTLS